jgi:hypothetical protein
MQILMRCERARGLTTVSRQLESGKSERSPNRRDIGCLSSEEYVNGCRSSRRSRISHSGLGTAPRAKEASNKVKTSRMDLVCSKLDAGGRLHRQEGTCSMIEMGVLSLQTIKTIEHRHRKCSFVNDCGIILAILCNLKFAARQNRETSLSSPSAHQQST